MNEDNRTKKQKYIEDEPIRSGDLIKFATAVLTILAMFGYITSEQADALKETIPSLIPVVLTAGMSLIGIVQFAIVRFQRANVTPWNGRNELVLYPEDPTGKHIQ